MYCGYKTMWAATHEKSTDTKHIQIQCVRSSHGSVDGCFLPSLPRHLPMWLDSDLLLTFVPCERAPFWWWLNTGHNPGCALTADLTREDFTDKGAFSIVLYLQQSKQENPSAAKWDRGGSGTAGPLHPATRLMYGPHPSGTSYLLAPLGSRHCQGSYCAQDRGQGPWALPWLSRACVWPQLSHFNPFHLCNPKGVPCRLESSNFPHHSASN